MRSLIVLFFLLKFAANAYGCECNLRLGLKDELKRSDIVISGRVIEILDIGEHFFDGKPIKSAGYRVKIEVLTIYKGQLDVKYIVLRGSGDNCDFYFRKGVEYLIYGRLQEGEVLTHICTRTAQLSDNPDVDELKDHQ